MEFFFVCLGPAQFAFNFVLLALDIDQSFIILWGDALLAVWLIEWREKVLARVFSVQSSPLFVRVHLLDYTTGINAPADDITDKFLILTVQPSTQKCYIMFSTEPSTKQ